MAVKPKKVRIRNTADLDLIKMYGSSPSYKGKNHETDPHYNGEFGHALNWCSRGLEPKDAKKELLFWMKGKKYSSAQIEAIKFVDEHYLGTLGGIAFLENNAFPIRKETKDSMKTKIAEFVLKGKSNKKTKTAEMKIKAKSDILKKQNTMSVDSQNTINAHDIYDCVEDSLFATYVLDAVRVKVLADEHKTIVLAQATGHIDELRNELVLIKTDKDVAEAYAHITKRNVTKIIKGLDEATSILENASMNKSVSRKPRKVTKPKSAAQQIQKLKYKQNDKDLGVNSVDPMLIVGAAKMIIFNTKTRKLGIYEAKDDSGFKVKGTSITNYDEKISLQKTVRAMKGQTISETITIFRKAPKIKSSKTFNDIKTLGTKMTGRMNDDILILKVYR